LGALYLLFRFGVLIVHLINNTKNEKLSRNNEYSPDLDT
jgi:hypothetical protein